ncbi:MAG: tetratricopeptide repeat protein, partial [Sphingobacteriales bacterium]
YIYILVILFFITATGFIVFKYKKEETVKANTEYGLLERKGQAANTSEWTKTKTTAETLLGKIKQQPNDVNALLELTALYVKEARVTGNHVYYDMAAMKYADKALKIDSVNFIGLVFKSLIQMSQHHFSDGLATAQKAQRINPDNAYVYGLIIDGNVEMGNYKAAVENADIMVSLRPDLNSYSRVSYLREIHGDNKGAIEAMKMAVDAGAPGDEGAEWARVQLGHLYENIGEMKYAEMHYTISLDQRPGYPYALAGMARIALAQKDYTKAISLFEQANAELEDKPFHEDLIETYRLAGNSQKADEMAKTAIEKMSKDAKASEKDENIGHYSDRELAYAYLNVKNYDKALEHAMLEYNRRPDNIDVNEAIAWVYYNKGEYDKALPYLKTALKTNSKNPTLLCRAGLIYDKTGDKPLAKTTITKALETNPNIQQTLKTQSTQVLKNFSANNSQGYKG